MIAGELLSRLKTNGIELVYECHTLRCRSEVPVEPKLLAEMKQHRQQLITELTPRQFKARAWLDDDGRLRMSGVVPADCSMLEVLVSLDASVVEIERHIHPIGSPNQWEPWTGERVTK